MFRLLSLSYCSTASAIGPREAGPGKTRELFRPTENRATGHRKVFCAARPVSLVSRAAKQTARSACNRWWRCPVVVSSTRVGFCLFDRRYCVAVAFIVPSRWWTGAGLGTTWPLALTVCPTVCLPHLPFKSGRKVHSPLTRFSLKEKSPQMGWLRALRD